MNTSIFKSDYIEIFLSSNKDILFAQWLNKSLLHEDFKKSVEMVAKLLADNGRTAMLVDAQGFKYVASTEVLAWHDTQIVPKYIKAGLKKIAFIQPASFFTELSTKKIFEQEKASNEMKQAFFKTEKEAIDWLTT